MKIKMWVIRCLCGRVWVMDFVTEHTCMCGAKLVRKGRKCSAIVDTDTYDVSAQPYHLPALYEKTYDIEELEDVPQVSCT